MPGNHDPQFLDPEIQKELLRQLCRIGNLETTAEQDQFKGRVPSLLPRRLARSSSRTCTK